MRRTNTNFCTCHIYLSQSFTISSPFRNKQYINLDVLPVLFFQLLIAFLFFLENFIFPSFLSINKAHVELLNYLIQTKLVNFLILNIFLFVAVVLFIVFCGNLNKQYTYYVNVGVMLFFWLVKKVFNLEYLCWENVNVCSLFKLFGRTRRFE